MYSVLVKDRLLLLQSLTRALCGDAHLSLEGDLSACKRDLLAIRDASEEETTVLKRHTRQTSGLEHHFVVLPLEPDTVETIARGILPRVGLRKCVWHIQIEKHGVLQFVAYDSFQNAGVVGTAIDEKRLAELVQGRALLGYQRHIP